MAFPVIVRPVFESTNQGWSIEELSVNIKLYNDMVVGRVRTDAKSTSSQNHGTAESHMCQPSSIVRRTMPGTLSGSK
jgi:hypothetical protein